MDQAYTCCFTGHREYDPEQRLKIEQMLDDAIRQMASWGYTDFICGGALGFDTLAARQVLRLRVRLGIRLHLCLPHVGQDARWSEHDREIYREILSSCDSFEYLYGKYSEGCMHERDRRMVDQSSAVVCWLEKPTGGTAYTVDYAERKGREIVRTAL